MTDNHTNTPPRVHSPLYDASPRRVYQENEDYQNTPDASVPLAQEECRKQGRSERAIDWFQRCQEKQVQERRSVDLPPETPAAAAWAFFRGKSVHGGTGIGFVDECITRRQQRQRGSTRPNQLPAMEIRDSAASRNEGGTGKTRTIVSLAAKFVVSTRESLFLSHQNHTTATTSPGSSHRTPPLSVSQLLSMPRVIVLDSNLDVTSLLIANSVSSSLLRDQQDPTTTDMAMLDQDMISCLSRIHVAHVEEATDWIPVLESIRCQLLPDMETTIHSSTRQEETDFPTLLLWDGFLSEPGLTEGSQKEITRQLALLLKDCNIGLIYTTSYIGFDVRILEGHNANGNPFFNSTDPNMTATASTYYGVGGGEGPLASTVELEHNDSTQTRHDFMATILPGRSQYQIPYSLSSAGVLR